MAPYGITVTLIMEELGSVTDYTTIREVKTPKDWRDSVIVPILKEKGDIDDCGN